MSVHGLREALLRQRARPVPVPESPGHAIAASRGHPMADIRRIARNWFGAKAAGANDARFDGRDVPPIETLQASAADLGLDVVYATRTLRSLEARDFPCVLLQKDGSSRVVLERPDKDTFVVDTAGVRATLARAELEADFSGTVFFVRPAAETGADTQAAAEPRPAPAGGRAGNLGLLHTISEIGFRNDHGLFRKLLVAAALSNLFMLALPLFTMAVYDRVIPHFALETLWALAIGVCIVLVLDFAIRFVRLKLVDAVALKTSLTMQAKLYRRILQMRLADAPRTSGGLATHVRELDAICQTVPPLWVAVVVDVPFFLILLGLLWIIGGPVVVAPVVGIAALAAISWYGHVRTAKAHVESATLARSQANQMIETVGALEWVKAANGETRLLRSWERLGDTAAYASHHGRLWANLGVQAQLLINQAVVVLTVIIGVYQIGAGAMTVGALAACTLLVGRAITPIGALFSMIDRLLHLAHTAESLEQLLKAPPEAQGDAARGASRSVSGRFDLAGVTFAYPQAPVPVLRDLSLSIAAGERIALIGRVGSGKSTLLRLLLRLHEPDRGSVLLDGHDIRQLPPRLLRDRIGFMRQESVLIDDTLAANLTFGLEDVPEAVFERAIRISGVKEMAARHPQGFSLPVGPRGERLSGGERQAVALARALMSDPRVLVLDEPTSAMDNTSEARVIRELGKEIEGRTLIVATHRAPLLQLVDRIVWIEGGRVVADGPREEILRKLQGQAA